MVLWKQYILLLNFLHVLRLAREQIQPDADGTYGEITTIADKKGPPSSLDELLENKIRIFIEDCFHMGLPRCKGKLSLDIQQYLKHNNRHVSSFINEKPGNNVFSLFKLTFS